MTQGLYWFYHFYLQGGSEVTWLQQCHTNSKCYCVWRMSTESVIVGRLDWPFTANVCPSPLFFYSHLKSIAAVVFSGRLQGTECIKCLTGGRPPRPQFWPFHHDWIHYQTAAPPCTICMKTHPAVQHYKQFPRAKMFHKEHRMMKAERENVQFLTSH